MGAAIVRGCIFAFACCLTTGSLLFTTLTLRSVRSMLLTLKDPVPEQTDGRSAKASKRTVLIWTGVSSLSFTVSLMVAVTSVALWVSRFGWSNNSWDQRIGKRAYDRILPFRAGTMSFQFLGYVSLLKVSVSRLTAVFSGTQFEISESTESVTSWMIILNSLMWLCSVIMVASEVASLIIISVLIPSLSLYASLALWIAWRFFTNLRMIAAHMGGDEKSMAMLSVSLRLAVVTVVAVLSTLLVSLSILMVSLMPGKERMFIIRDCLMLADSLLNTFCLLCSLSLSVRYYSLVFGRLHSWLLGWLSESIALESDHECQRINAGK